MFFEKYFCSFSKNIFFSTKKKSWDFFWITISMWNFVRNPFFASINETEQFWRFKTTSETFQKKVRFFWGPIFTGSIRYFIGSIQQKQFCFKCSSSLTLFKKKNQGNPISEQFCRLGRSVSVKGYWLDRILRIYVLTFMSQPTYYQ